MMWSGLCALLVEGTKRESFRDGSIKFTDKGNGESKPD